MERILSLMIGYAFGLIQTGVLYGRMRGIDIRKHGSGNSGATNTQRVLGTKAGIIVLAGDLLKCFIPCLIARYMFGSADPGQALLYVLYAGTGSILGHDFPFYSGFKGGKGIASSTGLILALYDMRVFLPCFIVFMLCVFVTKYVSLGSILSAATFFISWTVVTANGWNSLAESARLESCMVVFFVSALAIVRHRSNIGRLLAGKENKFSFKK